MTKNNATGKKGLAQGALIDSEDFIKEIVRSTLQEFLEAEMTEHLGAEPYERNDERIGVRNGHKTRQLKLTVGKIELQIPQTRDGSFSTELFERFQRSEKALVLSLIEMYQNGVSTRKVSDITEALCGTSFSKSCVSDVCKNLDIQIACWKSRSLAAHAYPYLFVDALYENVRVSKTVVSQGVLITVGVRDDGKREVLDVCVCDTESTVSYEDLFSGLKERGLHGVRLVTSDAHSGLKAAIRRYFQGAGWQRCQVHFVRDAMGRVALKNRKQLAADINSIFAETTRDKAMAKANDVADQWRDKAPKVADMIDEDIEQCLTALSFPCEHQRRIRTNNGLERLNEEIRRRDRVVRIFPNIDSALRLIAALCIEQSEEWMTSHQYLDMALLDQHKALPVGRIVEMEVDKLRKVS